VSWSIKENNCIAISLIKGVAFIEQ